MKIASCENIDLRELTEEEVHQVNGAILANIGMGVAGSLGWMGAYALAGGVQRQMSGAGFIGTGVGGFIHGFGGFNHLSGVAGGVASAGLQAALEDKSDS